MSIDDEIEDLLGPPTPKKKRKPYGKPLPPAKNLMGPKLKVPDSAQGTAAELTNGVTVFWLSKAFGMEVSTVRKRLADCPFVARKTSGYLYALPVAAQYLVRPRMNIREYIEQLKPHELPTQLQPTYWDGVLKRQKFEAQAKQLWYAEDVMEVYAEVFKAIKFTMQLWPDTLERGGMPAQERDTLTVLCDQLQEDIHRVILEMAKDKTTPSSLERFREMTENPGDEEIEVEDIL